MSQVESRVWRSRSAGVVTAVAAGARLLAAARRKPVLLGLLMAFDGGFIVLHLARHTQVTPSWLAWLTREARLDRESGVAERYGYVKAGLIVIGLVILAAATAGVGRWLLLAWASTYAVVLLDDALVLHERGGRWIADRWNLGDGALVSAQDLGEILTWVGLYVTPLVVLGILHTASTDPCVRRCSEALWVAAAALAFCGMALDLLHTSVRGRLDVLVGAAEDGGELLVLSVTLCAVLGMRAMVVAGSDARS